MKITVVNGSPRMNKGYTSQIITPLIKGMREENAEVDLLFSSKLKIKPCIGEFHCWYKKPGECIFDDDMNLVYKILKETDILILATPIYSPLPGNLQKLINRLLPLMEPVLENKNGRTRAKLHDGIKIRKIMLAATSGWWELENFNIVKKIVEELAANFSVEFGGAILRPHSSSINSKSEDKDLIINTLIEAGKQFVREDRISPEKLDIISKPLTKFEDYLKEETAFYQKIKNGL